MEILLLFLALLVMFYLLGPLALMAEQRHPVPQTRRIELDQAPEPVAKALGKWTSSLGGRMALVGIYELVLPRAMANTLPISSGHVLHFVDRDAGVHALSYVTARLRWQVFLTLYDEDQEVVTHNSAVASSFAGHPRVHVVRLAGMGNLAWLRGMHDAHMRHAMGARVPPPIPPDAALAEFAVEHEVRTVERQRELGMMHRRRGVYRPTLKGAFLSSWSTLPPLVFVRMWRNARRASALKRALRAGR